MTELNITAAPAEPQEQANWGAVGSMATMVTCLVAAELLPISLLSPMALDLHVSQGMAGQAISATSVAGVFSSLFVAAASRRLDRRLVLMVFTLLYIASNLMVGLATTYPALLAGRLLLGLGLGGFWSMAAAISMRLVPSEAIPRALSIIFGGVSVAMVLAAPLGSAVGAVIGWRGVFFTAGALGVIALVWQWRVLPAMPALGQSRLSTLFGLLTRGEIRNGMLAMMLVFVGHFVFFTYLRPFLETVTHVSVGGIAAIMLVFGIANVLGTFFSGPMIERRLDVVLASAPALMAVLAFGLVAFGASLTLTAVLVAAWGFAFGAVPVGWTSWVTRSVPDQTESAGGLQVAAIQLAVTLGASVGGLLLDHSGTTGTFTGSGLILLLAVAVCLLGKKPYGGRSNA